MIIKQVLLKIVNSLISITKKQYQKNKAYNKLKKILSKKYCMILIKVYFLIGDIIILFCKYYK